jgi:hypothetical protein
LEQAAVLGSIAVSMQRNVIYLGVLKMPNDQLTLITKLQTVEKEKHGNRFMYRCFKTPQRLLFYHTIVI